METLCILSFWATKGYTFLIRNKHIIKTKNVKGFPSKRDVYCLETITKD